MSASKYVGRVGGLAVAFGVGAVVFSNAAIAVAESGSADSGTTATSNSSASNSSATNSAPASSGRAATGRAARSAGKNPRSNAAPTPAAAAVIQADPNAPAALSAAPVAAATPKNRLQSALTNLTRAAAVNQDSASTPAAALSAAIDRITSRSAAITLPKLSPLSALLGSSTAPTLPVTALPSLPSLSTLRPLVMTSSPAAAVAAPANALVSTNAVGSDQLTPAERLDLIRSLVVLGVTAVAQMGMLMVTSLATIAPPSPFKAAPALMLNGYNVVPTNPETITSFYGRWTYLPGAPALIQGQQSFELTNPDTSAPVGTFDALVSRGNGYNYQELLITANDGTNVGTEAGQIPPVGSLISTFKILPNLGWSYSSMPTPSGTDAVSFKWLTPFGEFPMTVNFDAAKGIADHTIDNRPMDLMNGYNIAPTDPVGETFIGTSGILPLFTTVQGYQPFSVYSDTTGQPVGHFDGVFTTTFDIIGGGIGTQAVLVTANDGVNVGTGPGQTPPVGSVYNIMYIGDATYIYSALPAQPTNVVSLLEKTPTGKILTSPITLIDAAQEPTSAPLTTPDGYTFKPVGSMTPSGVNGLPPREVQVQGYQQFDVYDSKGNKIGRVDANVSNQWDLFGIYSRGVMVTKVTEGTAGTDPGQVPPVGSIYSFVNPGKGNFGTVHATVPAADADVTSYMVRTPVGNINFPKSRTSADGRTTTYFYTPL